ncbi:MAG: DUF1326 domain-containing protein [Alphaproteobacteria bacterium]|nr:DUF1326 domain-containing protein [Alphaproteobacteria bacterium]
MTPWEIRAVELANCNCNYGCPCQFNAPPTYGNCEAVTCMEVTEGHYGATKLDGLRFGGVFSWPKAIHEGNGKVQPFVDVRADDAQREAILKIMTGQDTDPMATVFAVFASTLSEAYDPIFAEIDFDVDVDARQGRFVVKDLAECVGEPIRNPVTGEEHRARIDIPHGFEYELAEMGSATATTQGRIALNLKDSYGQFAHLHLNNHGVVKHRTI